MYDIQDRPLKEEPTFQYKFLTSDPANLYVNPSQNAKRTVQIVAQSQIVAEARPSKRLKLDMAVAPSPRDVTVPNNNVDDEVGDGVDTSLPPHLHGCTTPIAVSVETPQQVDVNGDARSEEEEPLPSAATESLIDTNNRRSLSVVQSETIACAADQVTMNGQADTGQLEFIDQSQQFVVQLASPEDIPGTQADNLGTQADEHTMEVGEEASAEGQYIEGADGQLLQTDENGETTQVLIEGGVMAEEQFVDAAQVFQTEDGLLVIQAADGTLQIHGQNGQAIPMETVQALLGMDLGEGSIEQIDTEQVEQMQ